MDGALARKENDSNHRYVEEICRRGAGKEYQYTVLFFYFLVISCCLCSPRTSSHMHQSPQRRTYVRVRPGIFFGLARALVRRARLHGRFGRGFIGGRLVAVGTRHIFVQDAREEVFGPDKG